jgi:hypothetical protein
MNVNMTHGDVYVKMSTGIFTGYTRWFKYDRDKL